MRSKLIKAAKNARTKAYVPYSDFPVGAAVMTTANKIYTGCNIENSSYSLTCCAERAAIFKAVVAGEQEFLAMAVIGDTEQPINPCGACRQVMAEFFSEKTKIYLANIKGDQKTFLMKELLPYMFLAKDLP